MMTEGMEFNAVIESVSSDGNGAAHLDGFAVFVPFTAPGDYVKIRIDTMKKRYALGSAVQILSPSPYRRENDCPVFGKCGGCGLRHIEYERQLEIKKDTVENAMRRLGGFSSFKLEEIIGMSDPSRYRNKMMFPAASENGRAVCGLYRAKSRGVIDVGDCLLCDKINAEITDAVTKYMNENGIGAYNESTRSGFIRRVFTRKSFSNGNITVVICAAKKPPAAEKLVKTLRRVSDRITGIILNINTKKDLHEITDENETLWGVDTITDTICGTKFIVSPQSFFQVNPIQTEKLYERVLSYALADAPKTILDIYCGIGTISLCAAKRAERVIGVEIVERAVRDARRNAEINNIKNAEFYAAAAADIVPKLIGDGIKPDAVILDPPRGGSDEKTLGAAVKAAPDKIVYVSCNPATLARDAKYIADNGYQIAHSCAADMFPYTNHVETVCLLSKLKSKEHIYVDINLDELDLTKAEKKATYQEIKDYVLEHSGLKVSQLNIAQVKRKYGIIERENYNKPKSKNPKQPQCPPEKEAAITEAFRCFGMI